MNHLLALALLGVDCLVRAWRSSSPCGPRGTALVQDAFRLNLYGEAASQLTPNRLAASRLASGLHEAGLRPVTAIVAIGVEVACEWPVFVFAAGALVAYYVPDWRDAARVWLRHHRAGELVTIEITVLLILVTVYLLQRLVRSGFVSHRVRRQWRVAWAHVRRAHFGRSARGATDRGEHRRPRAYPPGARLGYAARSSLRPDVFGALALLHAPLVVPLPSGGGGLEVAFLNGFAGDFGRPPGNHAAVVALLHGPFLLTSSARTPWCAPWATTPRCKMFKIGWGKQRDDPQ